MIIAAAMAVGLSASAEALDLQSRAQLRRHALEQRQSTTSRGLKMKQLAGNRVTANRSVTLAFATLAEGASAADLEAEGMKVLAVKGDIAIVELAYSDVERIAESKSLRTLRLQREVKPDMDLARQDTGVDEILEGGDDLPQAYTGKGVIAAIVDQGIDPNHINFFDAEKKNRIDYLSYMTYNAAGTGIASSFYGAGVMDAPPISEFTTDATGAYHGTHTLGILAGSYRGEVDLPQGVDASGNVVVEKKANPYYGVAQDAVLAVASGELADAFIAYGMAYMDDYAHEYMQLPVVYSLSLGSSVGPHDPNSTLPRWLDLIGEDAIVVLSAGNEGDLKIALQKNLDEDNTTFKSMIYPYAYQYDASKEESTLNNTIRYGEIVFYSNDDTPFDVQAVIYNKSRNYREAKRMPKVGDNVGTYYCSSSDWQQDESDIVGDATFTRAFDGYVGVGGKVDEDTGRYYSMIDYYVTDTEENRATGNYVLGFEVTGKPGQRIECYCDGLTTWIDSYGIVGFEDGSTDGTISDMAVGYNVIVVGSYNTKKEFMCLDGGVSGYNGDGFEPGYVSGFSSYGTLSDGRELPTVCAPGAAIVSSISNPYLKAQTTGMSNAQAEAYINYICNARTTVDGTTYYWKQEVGTSMSTPFVAGSIALWLEADPTLKVADVRDIIQSTATVDEQVEAGDPVRWGAGKFNALAGLKEVIRRAGAGIEGVKSDSTNDRLMVRPLGSGTYEIFLGDAARLDIALYNLGGTCVSRQSVSGDEYTLETVGFPAGVYLLNVNGHSQKIAIR